MYSPLWPAVTGPPILSPPYPGHHVLLLPNLFGTARRDRHVSSDRESLLAPHDQMPFSATRCSSRRHYPKG